MTYGESINQRLRQAIWDSRISYQEIANKARIGLSTIGNYTGKKHSVPSADCLGKLCKALGVSADWVLGLTDESGKKAGQNTGYDPPNNPLTLDELRQMDGEPVWIHAPEIPQRHGWAIVEGFDDEVMYVAYAELTLDGYGKYWWAYRHKPEGENG